MLYSGPAFSATALGDGIVELKFDLAGESVNKLNQAALHDFDAATQAIAKEPSVKGVIVTSGKPVFIVGADVTEFGGMFAAGEEAVAKNVLEVNRMLCRFEDLPFPTVAAINGVCLGGGLELAITCDLRICAAGAKLGMPPAKLGLIYGHTGLMRFIETIGAPRTRELFFTGDNLDASRAEAINLVNRVVPDAEIGSESVELARSIAANAPLSTRGNKRAIATVVANPVLSAEQEAELVELRESCFASEDFHEGITAFGEKRKPRWTGR